MPYMATGKLAHLGCKFVSSKVYRCGVVCYHCFVVLCRASCRKHDTEQQNSDNLQLHNDSTTLLLTNLQPKCSSLPVAIYSIPLMMGEIVARNM